MHSTSERELDITVRALRAERIVLEEMLRDQSGSPEVDDTLEDIEVLEAMLRRMGECPAIIVATDNLDLTEANINTPIRYCTKKVHNGGDDHRWL